jgi:hypothetical protein
MKDRGGCERAQGERETAAAGSPKRMEAAGCGSRPGSHLRRGRDGAEHVGDRLPHGAHHHGGLVDEELLQDGGGLDVLDVLEHAAPALRLLRIRRRRRGGREASVARGCCLQVKRGCGAPSRCCLERAIYERHTRSSQAQQCARSRAGPHAPEAALREHLQPAQRPSCCYMMLMCALFGPLTLTAASASSLAAAWTLVLLRCLAGSAGPLAPFLQPKTSPLSALLPPESSIGPGEGRCGPVWVAKRLASSGLHELLSVYMRSTITAIRLEALQTGMQARRGSGRGAQSSEEAVARSVLFERPGRQLTDRQLVRTQDGPHWSRCGLLGLVLLPAVARNERPSSRC